MTSASRSEFDVIQQDQARLHRFVADVDRRIDFLARRLAEPAPLPTPPPLPRDNVEAIVPARKTPRPADQPKTEPPFNAGRTTTNGSAPLSPEKAKAPEKRGLIPAPSVPPKNANESWEMAFGTVWLARIGIVILITGLVFLGNYAWQHVVSQFGAGGKLTLIYLAGILLSGLGTWMERGKETMRNYARVLIGGGAATIYYATYAAHYVERLRVIESPVLGGTLLLGLAGAFIAWADRRRSQTVGMLAILLAYYTSAINEIGVFTLFSSFLLTAAAVFFLVRHRWTTLGWISMVGTYGSYTFWRWHHAVAGAVNAETSDATLWLAVAFLIGYWSLFSAAAFLGKESPLTSTRPSLFIAANNGAFFALAGFQFASHQPSLFWLFSLLFGGALLALAAFAQQRRPEIPVLERSYLAQGIALFTLGLISKLTGSQLALVLALESTLLLTGAGGRHGWLYQLAAGLTAAAATGVAGWEVERSPYLAIPLGGTVAVTIIGNAWWLKQRRGQLTEAIWSWRAAWFAGLGLLLLARVLHEQVSPAILPLLIAGLVVLATVTAARLRLPELLLGQLLLGWAVTLLLGGQHGEIPVSQWSILAVVITALGLEQWWHRQCGISMEGASRSVLQFLCATGAVTVLARCLQFRFSDESWLWVSSGAAMATLLYGHFTRAWATAIVGQIFTILSINAFVITLRFPEPYSLSAFIPIVTIAATGIVIERVIGNRFAVALPEGLKPSSIARIYRLTATAMLALWGLRFVPNTGLALFFAGLGTLLVLGGTFRRNSERAVTGTVFHAIALFVVWGHMSSSMTWSAFLAILAVPASLRAARYLSQEEPLISEDVRRVFTAAATATAWLWVTCWTIQAHSSQGLTIAWSALALLTFAAGLGLHERVYRVGGFSILALAIGRVFLVDVWRLETLYRILSFLVLGTVLLLLGYVYNRYAERIRKWL